MNPSTFSPTLAQPRSVSSRHVAERFKRELIAARQKGINHEAIDVCKSILTLPDGTHTDLKMIAIQLSQQLERLNLPDERDGGRKGKL